MTRTIICPIIVACMAWSCSKAPVKVEVDPDTGYTSNYTVTKDDAVRNGPYTKYDSAGVLIEKGIFHLGQLDGVRELYFPDGQVKVRERYKQGHIDDLYEYFHPNGRHELKGYYINGQMYGTWRKYGDDGALLEEVTMINNEEMGPFTEYYKDGKIQTEGSYLHGPNENGVLKEYDESGELYKTMWCDSGICHTTWQKK